METTNCETGLLSYAEAVDRFRHVAFSHLRQTERQESANTLIIQSEIWNNRQIYSDPVRPKLSISRLTK